MSADFWAGYTSGAVGILIGNPLDLIKVRLQASPASASNSLTRTHLSNQFTTVSSLIRGSTAPIIGYGALNALLFVTYNRTAFLLNGGLDPEVAVPGLNTIFLAGAVGGLATWAVSTPTELIKCRAQMSANPVSSWNITKEIFKAESIRGLYFGGTVTALRDSIGYGFYFWSYELSTRILASKTSNSSNLGAESAKVLICGGLAGVVTWASVFPLDVIKTRIQTQGMAPQILQPSDIQSPLLDTGSTSSGETPNKRLGAFEMAKLIYKNEGTAVFFRGLAVCSIRAFVVNAAQWAVYEWVMGRLKPTSDQLAARSIEVI